MDFRYSTEQQDLRASLQGFLRQNAPARDEAATAAGYDAGLWRELCTALELPGLHVPLEHGGAGGTIADSAIAFEELGRTLAPVPMAATAFTIEAVLRLGDAEQRCRLLPDLLCGRQIGALAAAAEITDPNAVTAQAAEPTDRTTVSGHCSPVLHGHVADLFVVPAEVGGRVWLYLVAADAPGVDVERLPSFDDTRPVAGLRLTRAPAERLASGPPDAIEQVLDIARVLLAAEMLGGAEACLQMSVDYAGSRVQFGRAIGAFQAIKHLCADMLIEIDATRAAVMFASMSAVDPAELRICGPLVKAQAADTFTRCAGSAIQVHGGIAFTWEHDAHRYFRRAKSTAALFGSSAQNRALLADRVGI